MKIKELEPLSEEELIERLGGLRKQLMELQFKRKTGVEKPHLFKQTKRTIARILTVLKQKEEASHE